MVKTKKEKFVFDEGQLVSPITIVAIKGAELESLKTKSADKKSNLNPVAERLGRELLAAPAEGRAFNLDSPYLISNKENVIRLFSKDIIKYVKRNSKVPYKVRGIGAGDKVTFFLEEKKTSKGEEKKTSKK